ncbi:MAG: nucleoside recognition domain-containing protein [Dorea sp.]
MKRNLVIFLTILFFICLLLFPAAVFVGASNGLLLWFQTVLPTLLPFLIATNLLIHTAALDWISALTSPLLSRIFHVSRHGSFVILAGFLCGYPMGSKMTADLLRRNRISLSEAAYLLSFCNNTSPMFIISYVLFQCLDNKYAPLPSLIILIVSPVICSIGFYHFYYSRKMTPIIDSKKSTTSNSVQNENLIDLCIMNGFETITKIGGYIIIFSIFIEFLKRLPISTIDLQMIFFSSLEITNGITYIGKSLFSSNAKYILCLFLTAFGGWCSVAQTHCMIQGTGLRIGPYIMEKLITAMVTSIFAIFYIHFFN